jgi:NAD-dependent deacetylase
VANVDGIEGAMAEAARLLRDARHAVALTGAGLSAESGIPTYRGPDGEWTRFGEPTIDGWELFCSDPAAWWEAARGDTLEPSRLGRAIETAEPNAGHRAMAELEALGKLAHVITQNIDDLHRRAGSCGITEIHGNRAFARCMNCGQREPLAQVRLERLPPLCLDCGGILKNDVVMFGEPIPQDALTECYRQTAMTDLFLVVGTSAVVYPAADFPMMAKRRGVPLIEVNPNDTALTPLADIVIRATAGKALPAMVGMLRAAAHQ